MKLVVALDLPTPEENLDLAEKFSSEIGSLDLAFKVGLNTFIAPGPSFISDLKRIDPS